MANSLKLRCLWATWQKIGLDLSPLYNSNIIGAVALFGGLGVTWRDSVVTAKSPQLACHLPDGINRLNIGMSILMEVLDDEVMGEQSGGRSYVFILDLHVLYYL